MGVTTRSQAAKPSYTNFITNYAVVLSVIGIYVCFLTIGVLQESIYSIRSESGRVFRYPLFVVAATCIFNAILALGFIGYERSLILLKRNSASVAPASMSYLVAMMSSNYALTQVNYPTQVLVKSAKSVPVILGGTLLFKKKYSLIDWLMVLLITLSLIGFNYEKLRDGNKDSSRNQTIQGLLALCISLICDSFTGPKQDSLFEKFNLSILEMILLINTSAIPLAIIASLIFEGRGPWIFAFAIAPFSILSKLTLYCICAALGQFCIVGVLQAWGSLQLTLITTTRKFLGVWISVLAYGHRLSVLQWLCVFGVFSSFLIKYTKGKTTASAKKKF